MFQKIAYKIIQFLKSWQKKHLHLFLLAPAFLVFLAVALYPLLAVFTASFTNEKFASSEKAQWVGIANYQELLSVKVVSLDKEHATRVDILNFLKEKELSSYQYLRHVPFSSKKILIATDAKFIQALTDTIFFTVASVSLELFLGILIAVLLVQNFQGRGFFRMAMLIPWAIPTAISSRIWDIMLTPSRAGIFNVIGQWLGITNGQFPFLLHTHSQIWMMVAIDVWKTTPFMALLLIAGLQTIDRELYEAAKVDGSSQWQQFWNITLPLLKPTIMIALVFRTLDALRVFDLFQIIFAQKRFSLASFSYYQLIDNKRMGYSSAASIVIFMIILCFTFIYTRISKEGMYD